MAGKERKSVHTINQDIGRLSRIRDKLWSIQISRIEEKTPERGSYTSVPIDVLVVNLNRNMGQLTVAMCNRAINKDTCPEAYAEQTVRTIKQAGDVANLLVMILDKLHLTDEDYEHALDFKPTG